MHYTRVYFKAGEPLGIGMERDLSHNSTENIPSDRLQYLHTRRQHQQEGIPVPSPAVTSASLIVSK